MWVSAMNRFIGTVACDHFEKAIADLTTVVRLKSDYATAYGLRGMVYQEIGDKAKAEADFAKAKSLGFQP